MELKLVRKEFTDSYTIGTLYVNGNYYCETLEDCYRDLSLVNKVYGQTAIPYGKYEILVTFSPRFRCDLPLLLNVPHFEGVRIHSGNNANDTEGCILLGINNIKGWVSNSRIYVNDLIKEMKSLNKNEKINIEICKL